MENFLKWALIAIPRWIRGNKRIITIIFILFAISQLCNIGLGEWTNAEYMADGNLDQFILALKGVGLRLAELLIGLPLNCCCCLFLPIVGGVSIYLLARKALQKWVGIG